MAQLAHLTGAVVTQPPAHIKQSVSAAPLQVEQALLQAAHVLSFFAYYPSMHKTTPNVPNFTAPVNEASAFAAVKPVPSLTHLEVEASNITN